MYSDKMSSCPNCLTPLSGNERTCPECKTDLKLFQESHYANLVDYSDKNKTDKFNKDMANNSINTTYTENAYYKQNQNSISSNNIQSNSLYNKNYATNDKDIKKKRRNIGCAVIISIAIIIYTVPSLIFQMLNTSEYEYNPIFEYNVGPIINDETTIAQISSYYASANVIELNKPEWLNTNQNYTQAPEDEGATQYYYTGEDGIACKTLDYNEFAIYYYNKTDYVFAKYDDYFTANYTVPNQDNDYNLGINFMVSEETRYEDVFSYIQQDPSVTLYDDMVTIEDVIVFDNGLKGYATIVKSTYSFAYIINIPIKIEGSEYIDIIKIEANCNTYEYDENGDYFEKIELEYFVENMEKYFYVENKNAPAETSEQANNNTTNDSQAESNVTNDAILNENNEDNLQENSSDVGKEDRNIESETT